MLHSYENMYLKFFIVWPLQVSLEKEMENVTMKEKDAIWHIFVKKGLSSQQMHTPPPLPLLYSEIKNWNTIKELFDQGAVKRNSFQWMILVQIDYLKLGSYFYVSVFWFLLKNILTNTEKNTL